jgi:hypothetical protein
LASGQRPDSDYGGVGAGKLRSHPAKPCLAAGWGHLRLGDHRIWHPSSCPDRLKDRQCRSANIHYYSIKTTVTAARWAAVATVSSSPIVGNRDGIRRWAGPGAGAKASVTGRQFRRRRTMLGCM